ncbi:alpha-L-fucosidase [Lentibacillus saliphilus]|uniref:alpha-L-fucosidase n=1 Tax=Lentibacillus saliphilus TaxID=2737028 RepID=UPI001C2FBAA9|nr:alpha-L-fucosidase [Lentibacillus saliphilus]
MRSKHIIKPTLKQLEFQNWGFGLFIHFGLRTFYEGYTDFDERPMSPDTFCPIQLNCEQWIETAKKAGMKYAVLTAKHHDGFSNWPSAYTTFSVKQSPWKQGKGDVVREFVDACRKFDMKPGLYYSPYDGAADFYTKDAKAYDDYFINQMTELLTQYGEIDILWFDGAGSEGHEYDWHRIVSRIRSLQPNILIFNSADPDIRWIGNEDGIAPIECSNVVDALDFSIYTDDQQLLEEKLWLPAECDVQIRDRWFYSDHNEHTLKSLKELMGIYDHSIGRGTNLLLNIGPDRNGLLPELDVKRILEMGAAIRKRYCHPLATMCDFVEENGAWVFETDVPILINHITIQEDLTEGERVRMFKIEVMTAKTGKYVTVHTGTYIGSKRIISIPLINVRGVKLTILKRQGNPLIKAISVYNINE